MVLQLIKCMCVQSVAVGNILNDLILGKDEIFKNNHLIFFHTEDNIILIYLLKSAVKHNI